MRTYLLLIPLVLSCGPADDHADAGAERGDQGLGGQPGPPGRDGRDAVVAGSRLKPLYWKGSDGTRVPSFYMLDTRSGQTCYPQFYRQRWFCGPEGADLMNIDQYVQFTLEQ